MTAVQELVSRGVDVNAGSKEVYTYNMIQLSLYPYMLSIWSRGICI